MWWAPVQRILKWALLATSEGGDLASGSRALPCEGNHETHICALAARKDFSEIKSLTEKPAFVCTNCGRVALSEQNLCKPFALDKISTGMPPIS
jgi:hypothetical protein